MIKATAKFVGAFLFFMVASGAIAGFWMVLMRLGLEWVAQSFEHPLIWFGGTALALWGYMYLYIWNMTGGQDGHR